MHHWQIYNKKNGEQYSKVAVQGNYGAYMVDNSKYPYHLVKWVVVLWDVDGDGELEVVNVTYKFYKGDHLCQGIWLEKLQGRRNWHTMKNIQQECVAEVGAGC